MERKCHIARYQKIVRANFTSYTAITIDSCSISKLITTHVSYTACGDISRRE